MARRSPAEALAPGATLCHTKFRTARGKDGRQRTSAPETGNHHRCGGRRRNTVVPLENGQRWVSGPPIATRAHVVGIHILESLHSVGYTVGVLDPADLLRQRGIQVTAQRLAVLQAVADQPHIAADRVVEVVRAQIGAISLQSVYDALGVLVARGLIRRIQPAGSPARFEGRVGDNHHHLICRACGCMVDVDCAAGSAPCLAPTDDKGYEIDEAEVVYWGRCPDCLAQAPPSPDGGPPARRPGRTGRNAPARRSTLRPARSADGEENLPG